MPGMGRRLPRALVWGVVLLGALGGGCAGPRNAIAPHPLPHELSKVALPAYVIESPDVILIDAIRLVPKPPYRVEPLDLLGIEVVEALPDRPIKGVFNVDADGTVNLGFDYGSVRLAGLTLEQARDAIALYLRRRLKPGFTVTVVVAESRALQLIRGPHLVQTDGTVNLGLYGSVFVDNMTIPDAKAALEAHLSQFLVSPEISVSVSGFNSKVFYLIFEGGGVSGDQILRVPMTGKTTVLDALAQLNGVPFQASTKRIKVVRPAPSDSCAEMQMPVDYNAIVKCGQTATNYQLFPGDRVYVSAAPLIKADAYLGRITAPFERAMGFSLLFTSVYNAFNTLGRNNGFGGSNNNNSTTAVITPIR